MNKFLFTILFLFSGIHWSNAQAVYRLKYQMKTEKDNTVYDALFVNNGNGGGILRIRFNNPETKEEQLVDLQVEEDYPDPINGITGKDIFFYRLSAPRFIRGNGYPGFKVPVYWFRKTITGNEYEPWGVTATLSNPNGLISVFDSSLLLNNAQLKSIASGYFNANEPFIANLNYTGSKALSAIEKNARVHLIIVANVNDPVIGNSCKMDMDRTLNLFSLLTKMIGIRLQPTLISGANYKKATVDRALDTIKPSPNDIVVFYYSGHGFRKEKDSRRYPYLDLREKIDWTFNVNSIQAEDIMKRIKMKGARLNLVITDCCNTKVTDNKEIGTPPPEQKVLGLELFQENVRNLFFPTVTTSIIATAADIDQKACSNDRFGGFFSYFFNQSLQEHLGYMKRGVRWDDVLKRTMDQTERKALRTYCDSPNICDQTPYYQVLTGR
ncbi:MAG: caspase family protein [Chitinophagaceae bacterium]|nr:caspase family protein [Chitinophagaceae bacterium]